MGGGTGYQYGRKRFNRYLISVPGNFKNNRQKKKEIKLKKILVTGGGGFIGAHLCERLLNEGNEVICLDNFSTGSRVNIEKLSGNKYFKLLIHDVTVPVNIEADQVYNLACPASPVHYQLDPVKTTRTSVQGSINMLDLARKTGARILQASTSEVYGDPEVHPQKEDYRGSVNPIGIRSCYDEGKRCAETLFFDYYRQYGIKIKVARIFNTYGPGMQPDDGRVISNFIVQALKNEDLTIFGTGEQSRSFCYVDDIVDGLVKLMNSRDGFRGPVNLGNTEEISILELAEKIISLTGSKSRLVYNPKPADDPQRRKPIIDLAVNELGWQPETQLEEGLTETIKYFTNVLLRKNQAEPVQFKPAH